MRVLPHSRHATRFSVVAWMSGQRQAWHMGAVDSQSAGKENGAGGGAAGRTRIDWVDYAKGLCIFAVVTMYTTHHVQQITQSAGWMHAVVEFAKPFRMPDFFLLAGLFVSPVLNRQWRDYLNSKILYFVYFYAVWVTFRFAFTDLRQLPEAGAVAVLLNYLQLYVEPPSGPLWFIYLLALFFAAVRLLHRLAAPLVLAAAAVLQVADVNTGIILVDKFAHYFVFFYAGYLFSSQVFDIAAWAAAHR